MNNNTERSVANKDEKSVADKDERGVAGKGEISIDGGDKGVLVLSKEDYSIEYVSILPPASEAERYEKLLPGITERWMKLTEDEATHRRTVENRDLDNECRVQSRGQIIAFILVLASLVVTVVCAFLKQSVGTVASVIVACACLAAILFRNRERIL
jgi:uncharacterized membrane protein